MDASWKILSWISKPSSMLASWTTDENAAGIPKESRYEIKLAVDSLSIGMVQNWLRLHPDGFSPTYAQRRVNNIYFDTPDLDSVEANLAGLSERHKLRLRWYGDSHEVREGAWELKSKKAGLGYKRSAPLGCDIALNRMDWQEISKLLHAHSPPFVDIQSLKPVLINHYERQYYASWDQSIRATVDSQQTFYDQRLSLSPNITRKLPFDDSVILEIKASSERYDELAGIIQFFPARVVRNSKYVQGVISANSF